MTSSHCEGEKTIRRTVATNFTGFALVAKHVVKAMLAADDGSGTQPAAEAGRAGVINPVSKTKKVVVLSSVQATRLVHMLICTSVHPTLICGRGGSVSHPTVDVVGCRMGCPTSALSKRQVFNPVLC